MDKIISLIEDYYHVILEGLFYTLLYSLIAIIIGAIFGSIIAIIRSFKIKPINVIISVYVEVIRGVPLLLQLLLFYYSFPRNIDVFYSIIIALIVNSSAYVSEIVRGGIESIDKGQTEAALALGLSTKKTMFNIVYPQAFKNILPSLGNEFIAIIKETSLASVLMAGDLMTAHKKMMNKTFLYVEGYIIIGAIYFIITFSLSKLVKKTEKKLSES